MLKELEPRHHLDPNVFDRFAKGPTSDLGPKIQKVLECDHGWTMSKSYQALFEAAGTEGLGQLKSHRHDGIALQAAWQEVLLTIPERRIELSENRPLLIGLSWPPESEKHPDKAQLNRFVNFMKKRANLEVPGWWEEILLGAEGEGPDHAGFPMPKDKNLYHDAGLGIYAPRGTKVMKNGNNIVLAVRNESVSLSRSFFEKVSYSQNWLSALMTPGNCYVAFHDPYGFSYSLYCVERKPGKILWEAPVGGAFWGLASGLGYEQYVAVTQQGARIVVFGACGYGAHVEAFDAKTGANLFRFSTSY